MFAYCGNNPVNRTDPSGRMFRDWDLLPNQESGKYFAEWYTNTDENKTDADGKLTLETKIKRTIRAVATSIEFVLGFGQGLYLGVSAGKLASADAGIFHDVLRIQYIDGKYDVCQYAHAGLDVTLYKLATIPFPSSTMVKSYLDPSNQWIELNEDDVVNLWGVSVYFFGGVTAEVNWDLLGLFYDLIEIWGD